MRKILVQVANPEDPEDQRIYQISGSFIQSLIVNTLIAYSARGVISSFNPAISAMSGLNQTRKSLLAISPLIPNILIPIPMSWFVHRSGGKKEAFIMVGIALTGMTTLSILSAHTNITTIDSFDWRYGLMFTSGFLIGHGAAAFQLMIDTLKWTSDREHIPIFQMIYSFIVDSASVTTPIIIYYMEPLGYYAPFTLFTSLILVSELSLAAFFHPSPYNQFKTVFTRTRARELAVESGELESIIGDYDHIPFCQMLKANLKVLWDRRSILLSFSLVASLGNAWFTKLILPSVLIRAFGFTQKEAIITSSLGYLVAILSRPLADISTRLWDNRSGGVKFHLIGCGLTVGGAIALTQDLPRWGLYLSLSVFNVGYGFNMITPLNIAAAWSKPANEHLNEVSPSNMFGLFNSFGSFGGILLPLILGFMVDDLGTSSYQNYFYIIVAMMLLSAVCVPVIDYQVRTERTASLFSSAATFFGGVRNYIANPEPAPNPRAIGDRSDIYLEKMV